MTSILRSSSCWAKKSNAKCGNDATRNDLAKTRFQNWPQRCRCGHHMLFYSSIESSDLRPLHMKMNDMTLALVRKDLVQKRSDTNIRIIDPQGGPLDFRTWWAWIQRLVLHAICNWYMVSRGLALQQRKEWTSWRRRSQEWSGIVDRIVDRDGVRNHILIDDTTWRAVVPTKRSMRMTYLEETSDVCNCCMVRNSVFSYVCWWYQWDCNNSIWWSPNKKYWSCDF